MGSHASRRPIAVGLIAYEGVQTVDLVGPADAFASANGIRPGSYAVTIASPGGTPVRSETGIGLVPDRALHALGPLDTLIVPGGAGLREPATNAAIAAAVARRAPRLRRLVSFCTGIYGLAPTGLLDGRRATTHWRFAADVAARFPAIRLEPDALYVRDGAIYTSAGITAAIDLTLALIEEDHGPSLALDVARDLVVYLRRPGGQRQYSAPLRFQARAGDRFADLAAWLAANLDADLSVERLAERVGLSPRQFARRFTAAFGASPAHQVESLRLDAARHQLVDSDAPIETIAALVGFASADAFRRAFVRRFGLSPTDFRARFRAVPSTGDRHVPPPAVDAAVRRPAAARAARGDLRRPRRGAALRRAR
jgi:transcriptional regulator GlxA family with amidase domain